MMPHNFAYFYALAKNQKKTIRLRMALWALSFIYFTNLTDCLPVFVWMLT